MTQHFFLLFLIPLAATQVNPSKPDLITQPKPGEEYVFVQSTNIDAKPVLRSEKTLQERKEFETAHKLPLFLTYALEKEEQDNSDSKVTVFAKNLKKREAQKSPAPAPPGATKIDVKALLAKYQIASSTTTSKPSSTTTKSRRRPNKRVKKETNPENHDVTSPRPVLTTGKAPARAFADDIPLLGAASDKQRSRIQIKKGPNGQEYEYEYVYYYYDDDDPKDKPITNAHDGPARNQIPSNGKKPVPEHNEVLPARGNKNRGRQLGEDETVNEERLPANTRFPPRSRNLNTTPLPEDEVKPVTRGRERGSASKSENDSLTDESQGSRGRTRANVHRVNLDLVDSDSFNTHSSSSNQGKPSFPQELPEGPESEPDHKPPAPSNEKV